VNVAHLGPVKITVAVKGGGGVVTASAVPDPEIGKLVVRMSAASRVRAEEHFARQERLAQSVAPPVAASIAPPISASIAPLASFKAAPFRDAFTGLVLMRDRWYDPSTGTFLTPDPEGYRDSPNLFLFGRGDPVNRADPTGRHTTVKRTVNGVQFELLAPDADEVRRGELGLSGSFINPFTGKRETFSWDQHQSELLLMQARWGNPLMRDAFAQLFGMAHDRVDVSGFRLYWNSLWYHKVDIALSAGFTVAMLAPEIRFVSPASLRYTQRTAGGMGRADTIRQSMGANGWAGPPIDVVRTSEGLVTLDHTRAVVAQELGIQRIPVRVHLPAEPLPPEMVGRFGPGVRTWGDAAAQRAARQRPPLPPTGTSTPPRLPPPGHQ
jgi:RHS repeat-associated protein